MSEITGKFKKNDTVIVSLNGLGSNGVGVGRVDGFTIFAQGGLTGEKVKVKLDLIKKNYAAGAVTEVMEASPDRVTPPCPIYKTCGGCQLQHLNYEGQLREKQQQVVDALTRIGHLSGVTVLPIIGAENPFYYRNKMQFPVAQHGDKLKIGCFAQATHHVVNINTCMIQKEKNNEIIAVVRDWMKKFRIPAYDEDKRSGIVRHVMGRVGVQTGEVMVVIVTAVLELPHGKDLVKMLKASVPGVKSVVQNINQRHTAVILGTKNRILSGKDTIKDKIGTLKFNISALSFFQVNSEQAEKLYGTALEFAALTGTETVVDVYCGTGTITLFLAKKAKEVYGIEIVAPAIKDARKNADDNKCSNAHFLLGDAANTMPELAERGIVPDVVIVDPPRAGCEERVLEAIAKAKPQKIVYVSCNPATLARDVAYLHQQGYEVRKVQPVDMFPMTHHVECVCLLTKNK